jgi:hypothetical protein
VEAIWQSHSIGRSATPKLGAIRGSIWDVGAAPPISTVLTCCGIRWLVALVPGKSVGDDLGSAIDTQKRKQGYSEARASFDIRVLHRSFCSLRFLLVLRIVFRVEKRVSVGQNQRCGGPRVFRRAREIIDTARF